MTSVVVVLGATAFSIAQYQQDDWGIVDNDDDDNDDAEPPQPPASPDMFEDDDDDDEGSTEPFSEGGDHSAPTLNTGQQAAYDKIVGNPGKSFKVEGVAGAGKSFLMKKLCEGHRVVAYTLHQYLGLKPGDDAAAQQRNGKIASPYMLRKTVRFILEEVGMIPANLMTCLNEKLCVAVGDHSKPFAGFQMIAVGDFLQMPSIGNDGLESLPLWRSLNLEQIYLTEQMRQSSDATTDGFEEAIVELRTLFMDDKPPSQHLCYAIDMLSTDTCLRSRPRHDDEFLGVCLTKKGVALNNLRHAAVVVDNHHRPWVVVPGKDDFLRDKSRPLSIDTRFLKKHFSLGSPEEGLQSDLLSRIAHIIPLVPGARVCVSVNIRSPKTPENPHGTMIAHNGRVGRFVGWSGPDLPTTDAGIRGLFGEKRPPLVVDGVEFSQVSVTELFKKGILPMVEFNDDNGVETITLPIVKQKGGGSGTSGVTFPIKAGQYVTGSSLQGRTITERMHIDFSGYFSFDPQIVYMLLSRVSVHTQLSIENMYSDTLYAWWQLIRKRVRENAIR